MLLISYDISNDKVRTKFAKYLSKTLIVATVACVVIFIIGSILSSEMINAKNNYNTYQIKTLPVGAISSVSEDAIKVILNPVKTDYLYFLSDNEGNTYFFKTYEEHQKKQKELKEAGKWLR